MKFSDLPIGEAFTHKRFPPHLLRVKTEAALYFSYGAPEDAKPYHEDGHADIYRWGQMGDPCTFAEVPVGGVFTLEDEDVVLRCMLCVRRTETEYQWINGKAAEPYFVAASAAPVIRWGRYREDVPAPAN